MLTSLNLIGSYRLVLRKIMTMIMMMTMIMVMDDDCIWKVIYLFICSLNILN
jgi:hypothetical protein